MSEQRGTKYRAEDSPPTEDKSVIGFSISHQRDNLLARGLGIEHLRDLLTRLGRYALRRTRGGSIAYGGHWYDDGENFTYDLLRLVSAEQQDSQAPGQEFGPPVGILYNHSPWPDYLGVTPAMEAKYIEVCRIVRISQEDAGFAPAELATESDLANKTARARFNTAVTLSAMRRRVMQPSEIEIPGFSRKEKIPEVNARILLGGKIDDFSGFLPGLFEEALTTLEAGRPTYILGGFGGAAEVMVKTVFDDNPPEEMTLAWLKRRPSLAELLRDTRGFKLPTGARSTAVMLKELSARLRKARKSAAQVFNTGLDDSQTQELMTTSNVGKVISLVRQGLENKGLFTPTPA